ncbi:transposase [Paenibacillus sp. MER TA 81-3]|uniref:transposase n=1 Tax=Paenibacillus sp. MER TA 81-3 TaxID=2939573 RepID=UPI00203C3984|nr:transposase [Paenibacillus sp. MER TA 81-3]MCM3340577.1 transposase [Paenibacillus sp. MER TA 81-3]
MALLELDRFEETWGAKYPLIVGSWRANWDELATFSKYPTEIRKLIYTTNMIDGGKITPPSFSIDSFLGSI